MPGHDAHTLAGIAAGVAAIPACRQMLVSEPNPIERVLMVSSAITGSHAPDILEPADSPEHRGFFHSILFEVLLAIGVFIAVSELLKKLEEFESKFRWYRANGWSIPAEDLSAYKGLRWIICSVVGFSCGYQSHLALDGTTPKGLPLLGS